MISIFSGHSHIFDEVNLNYKITSFPNLSLLKFENLKTGSSSYGPAKSEPGGNKFLGKSDPKWPRSSQGSSVDPKRKSTLWQTGR